MFDQVELPKPYEIIVYGSGKSRQARELYRAGVSVDVIAAQTNLAVREVSRALRQIQGLKYARAMEKARAQEIALADAEPFVTGCDVVFGGPLVAIL